MLYFWTQPFDYHPIIALFSLLSLLWCRLSPRLSHRAKSFMNIQKKVSSKGSVNHRPRNLHKFVYSQFGFWYYWSMSPSRYTAICISHDHMIHIVSIHSVFFLFSICFSCFGIGNFLYASCSYLFWGCYICLIWFSMQYSVLGQL